MQPISVVIIAKNAAHLLASTLQSVKSLTDDIVVCDTGSNDATMPVAVKNGARVIEEKWRGHGLTKNIANDQALYDWILQIDADEIVDDELLHTLQHLDLTNEKQVFTVRRKNFFKDKLIRYGDWRRDEPFRLFNRNQALWSEDMIHEKLIYEDDCTVKKLVGHILHKAVQSTHQYELKMKNYGVKTGEQYYKAGKKGAWYKRYVTPHLAFFNSYILKLGLLDGKEGLQIAAMSRRYTRIKYQTLHQLQKAGKS